MEGKKDFTNAAIITSEFLKETEERPMIRQEARTKAAAVVGRETPEDFIKSHIESPEKPQGQGKIKIRVVGRAAEYKTRRLQLLLKPSIYEKLKKTSEADKVSVNDLINQILEAAYREGGENE